MTSSDPYLIYSIWQRILFRMIRIYLLKRFDRWKTIQFIKNKLGLNPWKTQRKMWKYPWMTRMNRGAKGMSIFDTALITYKKRLTVSNSRRTRFWLPLLIILCILITIAILAAILVPLLLLNRSQGSPAKTDGEFTVTHRHLYHDHLFFSCK